MLNLKSKLDEHNLSRAEYFRTTKLMVKVFTLDDKIKLCDLIASGNKGILTLTKDDPKLPGYSTIRKWIREDPLFRAWYISAKQDQADFLVDEMIEIADNCVERRDAIEKCKLMLDARKFAASTRKPKMYSPDYKGSAEDTASFATPSLDYTKLDKEELNILRTLFKKAGSENAAEYRSH